MDLNATILGQMISFILFIIFCMKYIWPNIINTIEDRKNKILNEFSNIKRLKKQCNILEIENKNILEISKKKAKNIIDRANIQTIKILEIAKKDAEKEKQRIISEAYEEINLIKIKIKNDLIQETVILSTKMAKQIMQNIINKKNNNYNFDKIINNL